MQKKEESPGVVEDEVPAAASSKAKSPESNNIKIERKIIKEGTFVFETDNLKKTHDTIISAVKNKVHDNFRG